MTGREKATLGVAWSPPKDTKFRRRLLLARHLLMTALLVRRGYRLCTLGNKQKGCSWTFCPDGLNSKSIVYSGGIGNDLSFEHDLVKQCGCTITLFDPTPTGVRTMERPENRIPQFKFLPVGLAGHCGILRLAPPMHPEEGSWFSNLSAGGGIEVPVVDFATMLSRNEHSHADLLKIDIEGAEYGVIEHILSKGLKVRQLLVEYHDSLIPGIRRSQSLRSMFRLMAGGYRMIAERSNTLTFLRKD
jgi:FkbM family methyltransferase